MEIFCKNIKKAYTFSEGVTFFQIFNEIGLKLTVKPLCASANGKMNGMDNRVYQSCDVLFHDRTTSEGARCYANGLITILSKAISDVFPGSTFQVSNAISKGIYCPVETGGALDAAKLARIRTRMDEIIAQDLPIESHRRHTVEVAELMEADGRHDTALLLRTTGKIYSVYYTLDGKPFWVFGSMPSSTGLMDLYGLELMGDGILLRVPDRENPTQLCPMVTQDKMYGIFQEHHKWMDVLGFSKLGELNSAVQNGDSTMIINIAEALQAKKIVHISDQILERRNANQDMKLIMVSGPSSSGKTTFSKRLQVQLLAHGLTPKVLSLDDYFVDREHTPRDANGDYDFESLYAIDIKYFNEQLKDLLAGKTILPPCYNFKKGGVREFTYPEMSLGEHDVLLIEGIHALNPDLMPDIPASAKFLIYVSALTSIRLDGHNYIPSTDNRLLRRIIRDHKYRKYSARDTIARWPSVRHGEETWIFPYQENADAMFNSAMLFELSVIKDMVTPILEEVPEDCPEYGKAKQLMNLLKLFTTIPSQNLPPTSLVREFIGGSSFHY